MKSEKKFLVTGSTGATGGETVEQLLEKGHSVRALVHREDERSERLSKLGAEVVFGDLLDMESVRSALRGIYGAYFVYPIRLGIVDASVRWQVKYPFRIRSLGNAPRPLQRLDVEESQSRQMSDNGIRRQFPLLK
jgi:NAD(P)H dehydrogenase (quinone)